MASGAAVTAIVVNWNGMQDTLRCVDSLRTQDYACLRILVVDNASTDGSTGAVRRAFRDIDLLALSENRGFAAGANRGIRWALDGGADYILLLNNDVVADRRLVSELLKAAAEKPAGGILGPKIYFTDSPRMIWAAGGRVGRWSGRTWHVGIGEKDKGQYDAFRAVDYLPGAGQLIRQSVFRAVGLLDESYEMYYEEVDFNFRARQRGFEILYVPSALLWHRVSASIGGERDPRITYYMTRNRIWFMRRHISGSRLGLFMSIFLAESSARLLFYLGRGEADRVRAVIRGLRDGLGSMGRFRL